MWSAIVTVRLLALSQALLTGLCLLNVEHASKIRLTAGATLLTICGYLTTPLWPESLAALMSVTAWLGNLVPPAVALLIWALFSDEAAPPRSLVLTSAAYFVATLFAFGSTSVAVDTFMQIAKLAFAVYAFVLIWRGRDADLIDMRLRVRQLFLWLLPALTAAVVIAELVTLWDVPQAVELVGMAVIFALFLTLNLSYMSASGLATFLRPAAPAPDTVESTPDPLATNIVQRVEQERLYADHGLRIGQLAALVDLPEYQVRQLINQQLGYPNFNQFINTFRVREATRQLIDEPGLPVLTIALDVGFRSISAFNAAFRQQVGCSPTAYRKENLPESEKPA